MPVACVSLMVACALPTGSSDLATGGDLAEKGEEGGFYPEAEVCMLAIHGSGQYFRFTEKQPGDPDSVVIHPNDFMHHLVMSMRYWAGDCVLALPGPTYVENTSNDHLLDGANSAKERLCRLIGRRERKTHHLVVAGFSAGARQANAVLHAMAEPDACGDLAPGHKVVPSLALYTDAVKLPYDVSGDLPEEVPEKVSWLHQRLPVLGGAAEDTLFAVFPRVDFQGGGQPVHFPTHVVFLSDKYPHSRLPFSAEAMCNLQWAFRAHLEELLADGKSVVGTKYARILPEKCGLTREARDDAMALTDGVQVAPR